MVKIKLTRLVVSPQYGNCAPGDVIACSEEFAKHIVDELGAAVYLTKVSKEPAGDSSPADSPVEESETEEVSDNKPKRRKGARNA